MFNHKLTIKELFNLGILSEFIKQHFFGKKYFLRNNELSIWNEEEDSYFKKTLRCTKML